MWLRPQEAPDFSKYAEYWFYEMSLDLKPLHFQNLIVKSLSIESVEYCYIIPIISQLADYWGDVKMLYFCKKMSRQMNQHLNQISHIHFQISGQGRDCLVLDCNIQNLLKIIGKPFSNSVERTYKEESVDFGLPIQKKFFDSQSKRSELNENINFLISKKNKLEEKNFLSPLQKIDNSFFQLLEETNSKKNTHSINANLSFNFVRRKKIVDKEVYFLLLQLLRDRKLWKAEEWYPSFSRLLFESSFFLLSPNCIQLSQSEKRMTQILNVLLNKQARLFQKY